MVFIFFKSYLNSDINCYLDGNSFEKAPVHIGKHVQTNSDQQLSIRINIASFAVKLINSKLMLY